MIHAKVECLISVLQPTSDAGATEDVGNTHFKKALELAVTEAVLNASERNFSSQRKPPLISDSALATGSQCTIRLELTATVELKSPHGRHPNINLSPTSYDASVPSGTLDVLLELGLI